MESLPSEILALIFAKLPHRDLASVERTCRIFRNFIVGSGLWVRRLKRIDAAEREHLTRRLEDFVRIPRSRWNNMESGVAKTAVILLDSKIKELETNWKFNRHTRASLRIPKAQDRARRIYVDWVVGKIVIQYCMAKSEKDQGQADAEDEDEDDDDDEDGDGDYFDDVKPKWVVVYDLADFRELARFQTNCFLLGFVDPKLAIAEFDEKNVLVYIYDHVSGTKRKVINLQVWYPTFCQVLFRSERVYACRTNPSQICAYAWDNEEAVDDVRQIFPAEDDESQFFQEFSVVDDKLYAIVVDFRLPFINEGVGPGEFVEYSGQKVVVIFHRATGAVLHRLSQNNIYANVSTKDIWQEISLAGSFLEISLLRAENRKAVRSRVINLAVEPVGSKAAFFQGLNGYDSKRWVVRKHLTNAGRCVTAFMRADSAFEVGHACLTVLNHVVSRDIPRFNIFPTFIFMNDFDLVLVFDHHPRLTLLHYSFLKMDSGESLRVWERSTWTKLSELRWLDLARGESSFKDPKKILRGTIDYLRVADRLRWVNLESDRAS